MNTPRQTDLKSYLEICKKMKVTEEGNKPEILHRLLIEMGYDENRYHQSSVQKWISGERQPNLAMIDFKNQRIDFEKFSNFLSQQIDDSWESVRDSFKNSWATFDTNEKEEFYSELLAYLLEILNIPVPNAVYTKRNKNIKGSTREPLFEENSITSSYSILISGLLGVEGKIRSKELLSWESVENEVKAYLDDMARKNIKFTEEDIDLALSELKRIWRNPQTHRPMKLWK